MTTRDARFQQWRALLDNRQKRQRAGELLVQGVRPITLAIEHGWTVSALLHDTERPLSRWARDLLSRSEGVAVAMAPALLRELGDKSEEVPELLAVVRRPPDDLSRIPARPDLLVVLFDRPGSPGNIGTLVRSADAFGAAGVIVTGHAADVYDPKSVRASTGSLFALPVVRIPSHREVLAWVETLQRQSGLSLQILGTDERAERELESVDLRKPTLLLVGNETVGLSAAWRQACHHLVRIPISGAASSLNAAAAGTVALYEAARQRHHGRRMR